MFLKENPGVDLEEIKKEEEKFAAMKKMPKSDKAAKPPRPKEKGIVIKEANSSDIRRPKMRSQTISEADLKNKGNNKVDEPPAPQVSVVPKTPKVTIDPSMKVNFIYDDITIHKEEIVEFTKKRKLLHVSDTCKL